MGIALHPYLFGRGTGQRTAEDVVRASGKVEFLDRLLRKLLAFQHKVLVFSQFTSVLDILEELLALRSWAFERIDGQVSAEDRQAKINTFSEPTSSTSVFLLSTRAGAVGLNLQAADTVVLFDLDWNPQNDKQAIARAHRIGQTKEVLVLRLLTTSAIELHMERTAREKLDLEKKIIGAGGFSKKGSAKTAEERAAQLKELLGAAESCANLEAHRKPTSFQDVNMLAARSDVERKAFDDLDESLGLDNPADMEVDTLLMKSNRLMSAEDMPAGFEVCEGNSDSE